MSDIKNYHNLRNKYKPNNIKLIFLLESPPANGLYFYDKSGAIGEPLFRAMMRLINFTPQNKEEGLKEFCRKRCFLVDATYTPVNKMKYKQRKETILNNQENLKKDLKELVGNKNTPIVIVKCTLYDCIYDRINDKFNIINGDIRIPFPSHGNQNKFHDKMRKLLTRNNLKLHENI